ncbi:mitochondrial fission factor homolog B isoform X1 [Astyanax mexicanus]|uniref:mitochondrial fission factor homolog B isoform X1 n=1 Tax=Astyanax mexicanus TaxID=7994 RepID=UPI0020CABA4C|nr:mitochondrial fission factor homolog B isoform X1 [Astyanax mexicanus]
MAATRDRTAHEFESVTACSNPFISPENVNETRRSQISFEDWMSQFNDVNGNSVQSCNSVELNTRAAAQPSLHLHQVKRETNPFKICDESTKRSDSGIESQLNQNENCTIYCTQCCPKNTQGEQFSQSLVETSDLQHINPFSDVQPSCYAESTPINANYHPVSHRRPVDSPFTPKMPPVQNINAQTPEQCAQCDSKLTKVHPKSGHTSSRSRSSSVGRRPRHVHYDISSDSEGENTAKRERIPTLRPGQFDGTGSWKEFLHRFEGCAEANHWSEKTMAVQLRFCLAGAAGAVIHKNPRSSRWSYARIVEEIEAAYGSSSEHAAAIGIELRQRVRKPGEPLHILRDDIYEKVSIVYADWPEAEQDRIGVEVFTNALGEAGVVQRLLEEHPRTLARAYELAHRYF